MLLKMSQETSAINSQNGNVGVTLPFKRQHIFKELELLLAYILLYRIRLFTFY